MMEAATVFQATDLARNAREVLDAARKPQGALIQDKDGTNFRVVLATRASQDSYIADALSDAIRLLRLASLSTPDPALYGNLAWILPLPSEAQLEFAWAYAQAIQSVPLMGVEPVETLVYAWYQTARAWSDASLRDDLLAQVSHPLDDIVGGK